MSFRQECSVVAAAHTAGAATECKETAEKRCKENNGEKTRKRDFCYSGPVFDFFYKLFPTLRTMRKVIRKIFVP